MSLGAPHPAGLHLPEKETWAPGPSKTLCELVAAAALLPLRAPALPGLLAVPCFPKAQGHLRILNFLFPEALKSSAETWSWMPLSKA